MTWYRRFSLGLLALALMLAVALVHAAIAVTNKISDVRGTKHNLSAAADGSATPSGGTVPVRTIKASSETQVCVFCHTPHGASTGIAAPLWNRTLSGTTYDNTNTYSSSSMEASAAELAAGPGGNSKICLSCHDGTMAIDKVNVMNGAASVNIPMTASSAPVYMPAGAVATGFTRDLGTTLANDHPISFTYNSTLAGYDGELRGPDGTIVGNRVVGGTKPKLPLESDQMQCTTCHDPHLRDKTTSNGNAKFLRLNRFQVTQPGGGAFSTTNDIICLACHDKGGVSWAYSAHANSNTSTQQYKPAAAQQREFPSSLDTPANTEPPVWQVACLNCHDTHTVAGARRLLREGTDSASSPKSGGSAALEETCYQCHTTTTGSAVTYTANTATAIPDIKSDFTTAGNKHMPIATIDQANGTTEVHDIGGVFNDSTYANCSKTSGQCGKDMLESRAKLGSSDLTNRHAECTDCHNPHRVIKYKLGLAGALNSLAFSNSTTTGDSASGTHRHTNDNADIHSNVISGVLRGSWGVEPAYPDNSFQSIPTAANFVVKRGDPGSAATPVTTRPGAETYVTREYQICLKCHSNYAYPDTGNAYPNSASRPQLGGTGLTASNANGGANFTSYTNQAKEFQAPSTHAVTVGSVSKGFEGGAGSSAAVAATNNNNHRSWHPVMAPTGRTGRSGQWIAPWNDSGTGGKAGRLGVQTMYCSDCHGSNTADNTAIPANGENGSPWGPHGSANNFLLKGNYNTTTGVGQTSGLCFKCHSYSAYATGGGGTGFQTDKGDGHKVHRDKIKVNGGSTNGVRCNWCHVAVPHGWKNRNLLVNLKDVGPEDGKAAGTSINPPASSSGTTGGYTDGPYYRNAFLRIDSFPAAGVQWTTSNCMGGLGNMQSTCKDHP